MKKPISRRSPSKRLVGECLEPRQLMAADMVYHNFMMPEDSNMSGSVTPLDALIVINRLNSSRRGSPSGGTSTSSTFAVDVNANGSLSPLDALLVINFLNRSRGGDEILTSRVDVQSRIERLDEAIESDLLPPNIDLVMATQIRQILEAGGFPEVGDRMIEGVLKRQTESPIVPPISDPAPLSSDDTPGSDGSVDSSVVDSAVVDLSDRIAALEQAGIDIDLLGLDGITEITIRDSGTFAGGSTWVNDPTNDNGNGSFLDGESASSIVDFVETELRKQLKVDDDAAISVAVFNNPGEVISGTWFYLTEEGIGVSGNWSYVVNKPETLNLFRSNVDIEKRIYVQYPGSGFIYYSWLPEGPVGFYFSPIGNARDFKPYFDNLPGSDMSSIAGFVSFSGDLGVFDGIAAIEKQASDLYAIDRASKS